MTNLTDIEKQIEETRKEKEKLKHHAKAKEELDKEKTELAKLKFDQEHKIVSSSGKMIYDSMSRLGRKILGDAIKPNTTPYHTSDPIEQRHIALIKMGKAKEDWLIQFIKESIDKNKQLKDEQRAKILQEDLDWYMVNK